jgi:hypothetical protein
LITKPPPLPHETTVIIAIATSWVSKQHHLGSSTNTSNSPQDNSNTDNSNSPQDNSSLKSVLTTLSQAQRAKGDGPRSICSITPHILHAFFYIQLTHTHTYTHAHTHTHTHTQTHTQTQTHTHTHTQTQTQTQTQT